MATPLDEVLAFLGKATLAEVAKVGEALAAALTRHASAQDAEIEAAETAADVAEREKLGG